MRTKIGLLGGTFDPVHAGHVQLAELAMAEQDLTMVLFIPAAAPPHKHEMMVTAYSHRLAMLKLALADYRQFAVCQADDALPRPSYTIDTICYLQNLLPRTTDMYFIIGLDAFLDITSWKAYEELLCRVHLLVAHREDSGKEEQLAALAARLQYTPLDGRWRARKSALRDIVFLQGRPLVVSSSAIRRALREGGDPGASLGDGVRSYINQHGLYR